MRISPVGDCASSFDEVTELSRIVTKGTHDHPEGLKGATAVAQAIYLARRGACKSEIASQMKKYYDLEFLLEDIPESYSAAPICQKTVPQAIKEFLEAISFEETIRNAISIGGDSDTIAAIACSIAEAYYGVPETFKEKALRYLDKQLLGIYEEWQAFNGEAMPNSSFDLLTKYITKFKQQVDFNDFTIYPNDSQKNKEQSPDSFNENILWIKDFKKEVSDFFLTHLEYIELEAQEGIKNKHPNNMKVSADEEKIECALANIFQAIKDGSETVYDSYLNQKIRM